MINRRVDRCYRSFISCIMWCIFPLFLYVSIYNLMYHVRRNGSALVTFQTFNLGIYISCFIYLIWKSKYENYNLINLLFFFPFQVSYHVLKTVFSHRWVRIMNYTNHIYHKMYTIYVCTYMYILVHAIRSSSLFD